VRCRREGQFTYADHGERKYRIHDLAGFAPMVEIPAKDGGWRDWPAEVARLLGCAVRSLDARKYGTGRAGVAGAWSALQLLGDEI
jgi:hypothetical protein